MTASISTLPVWKKDSTAAEWLQELAAIALEHPDFFSRAVLIYEEKNSDGLPFKTRMQSWRHEHNTGIIGALQVAQLEYFEYMKGRRD